ncbi:MFS transporter [Pseudonocardia sp. MCCB 268]|nr:MFS transporter [Pseudonocardia cytotoxica]
MHSPIATVAAPSCSPFGAAVASARGTAAVLQPTFVSQVLVRPPALLVFACYAAIRPAGHGQQFPTEVRTVGSSLPYGLGVALFGGTAPLLIEWLTSRAQRRVPVNLAVPRRGHRGRRDTAARPSRHRHACPSSRSAGTGARSLPARATPQRRERLRSAPDGSGTAAAHDMGLPRRGRGS